MTNSPISPSEEWAYPASSQAMFKFASSLTQALLTTDVAPVQPHQNELQKLGPITATPPIRRPGHSDDGVFGDVSPPMIRTSADRVALDVVDEISKVGLAARSVDVVVANQVVEHLEQPLKALVSARATGRRSAYRDLGHRRPIARLMKSKWQQIHHHTSFGFGTDGNSRECLARQAFMRHRYDHQ